MTKLEQLINDLCPDGVKYKSLNECVDIMRGTRVVKNNLSEDGKYPVYQNSLTPMGYHIESNASKDTTFIIVAGAAGEIGYSTVDFWAADDCFCLKCHQEITSRFLYHLLLQQQSYIYSKVRKASIPRLSRTVVEKITIPVPPLPVQAEIVRILDKFTQLEAELEAQLQAELDARRKQYEHYRNVLLSFDMNGGGTTNCEWRTVGELFEVRNGYTPSKSNAECWENGTVPWFRMEDIRENGRVLSSSMQNVTIKAVKNKLFSANSIIISTSATIGEHALITVDFMCNQRFTCLTLKKEYQNKCDMMFLFYYCFKLSKYCLENLNQSSFASVDMAKFYKFSFPLIPISEQTRTVSILDRFDALCSDITQGLPAEIDARRKQYEYYRDKLLTFQPMA